jgi:hypothetical protein
MKSILILITAMSLLTNPLTAAGLGYQPSDTTQTVLQRQTGQLVELRLKSGETLKGKVAQVSDKTLHLKELVGQEFFEALVVIDDISAVIVRAASK